MSLIRNTLWALDSRIPASFEVTDGYCGLSKGRIDLLSSDVDRVVEYQVDTTGNTHTIYHTLSELITGIGGTKVTSPTGTVTIEFDISKGTIGHGIWRVLGGYHRELNPTAVITQLDAVRYMRSYGIDTYKWNGSQTLSATEGNNHLNIATLDFEVHQASGDTILDKQKQVFIIEPAMRQPRGVLVSTLITGNFINKLPHEVCLQIKKADASKVYQSAPVAVTSNTMTQVCANAMLYTEGLAHEFNTDGFQVNLMNLSSEALTVTSVDMRIHTFTNPDFSA